MATKRILALALVSALTSLAYAHGKLSYEHYAVYKVDITTQTQLEVLQNLESLPNGVCRTSDSAWQWMESKEFSGIPLQYTFLDYPASVNMSVEVVVPPAEVTSMERLFRKHEIQTTLLTTNLQQYLPTIPFFFSTL